MPFSILYLTKVSHLRDYVLDVEFSDGSIREVDLADELHGPVFEPLRDVAVFSKAYLDTETRTASWPNGADLAPEFLREIGREVRVA